MASVVTGGPVPGRSGCISASPCARLLTFLPQNLGCRLVVDMLEAEGLDCDSHDIVHLTVGLQEVQILVSNMLE